MITHLLAHCPAHPGSTRVPTRVQQSLNTSIPPSVSPSHYVSNKSFKIDVMVKLSDLVPVIFALIDSGTTGNFMASKTAKRLQIPSQDLK